MDFKRNKKSVWKLLHNYVTLLILKAAIYAQGKVQRRSLLTLCFT